jgi:itaconate CoA-transferase
VSPLPLDGITVVSVEQAVAAPLATRQLADWGARVIKVENPRGGDFARRYDRVVNGQSSHFVWLNRSKESFALDLDQPESPDILSALVSTADVFVHNLGPGTAERHGLDAPTLRHLFPRLIHCSISGYGITGPFSRKKAYDLLVQSEAGLLGITGTNEHPSKVGISIADIAGGMYAFSGILLALFARQTTGDGATLAVSLFDALVEWMGYPLYYTMYAGDQPSRVHFCEYVLRATKLAEDERFKSNPDRVANRDALEQEIGERLRRLNLTEIVDRLETAKIAHARLNSINELINHPQLRDRDRWRSISTPAGDVPALLPPLSYGPFESAMGPVPGVGEHTARIFDELGIHLSEPPTKD